MKVIDLFAGPGGWDVAAHWLGVHPLGVEFDDAACATREAAGLATLQADVSSLDPADFEYEGLIASPPCQAFSMAGRGEGRKAMDLYCELALFWESPNYYDRLMPQIKTLCEDERAHLVMEPLRWVTEGAKYPEWIALEQVPPVLPIWEAMAETLAGLGYGTWTGELSSEQFGVPQTRKRAFLIARLDEEVEPPRPTHQRYIPPRKEKQETSLFDAGERERIIHPEDRELLPWVSMAEALQWGMTGRPAVTVPAQGETGGFKLAGGSGADQTMKDAKASGHWAYRNGTQKNAAVRPETAPAPTILFGHSMNEVCWVTERPSPTIVGTRRSDAGGLVGRQMAAGEGRNVGGNDWVNGRPSTTVCTTDRVAKAGHHEHNMQDAVRVTAQEAAILQSFPPDYPWQGTKTKQFQQIGNAVPPLLALAVLDAVVPTVAREEVAA